MNKQLRIILLMVMISSLLVQWGSVSDQNVIAADDVGSLLSQSENMLLTGLRSSNSERSIQFPANALSYNPASPVIEQVTVGLRWGTSVADSANLIIERPNDWDGTSDISFDLHFLSTEATAADVQFFIRPGGFNPGERLLIQGIGSFSSSAVPITQSNQVQVQNFTIPASRFGSRTYWAIGIQRRGTNETYHDDVILTSVSLRYEAQAASPASGHLSYPANALNFLPSANLYGTHTGMRWENNQPIHANIAIPRPSDWNGVSDIILRLQFTTTSAAAGNVRFFIRPRAFNPGQTWVDASSVISDAVPVSGDSSKIYVQTFTIPAGRFGDRDLWWITIQRAYDESYSDDVIINSVSLEYTQNGSNSAQSYPANALNYSGSTVYLTQNSAGIQWQSDFRGSAFFIIPRPTGWEGYNEFTLSLYFFTTSDTNADVQFFIRPRAFNPGDRLTDAPSIRGTPVPVSAQHQIQVQTITIPADRFGDKDLWVITIQREGLDETYRDDINLTSVSLSYTDMRIFLPLIIN